MNHKDLKRLFFCISFSLITLLVIGLLIMIVPHHYSNYDDEILLWTKIGSLGGWYGAIFGAIALIISIVAIILPSIAKIEASMMFGYIGGVDEELFETLIITVKNTGMKAVSIRNIYLKFEKFEGTIIISTMGMGTPAQFLQPDFPKRLDVGEEFKFFIPLSKMIVFLKEQNQIKPSSKAIIVVNEVTEGNKFFKTRITKDEIVKP